MKQKIMLKLLKSLVLLAVAITLGAILFPLGLLYTIVVIVVRIFKSKNKKNALEKSLGYLGSIIRSVAVGIDQIGNSVCRDLFNRILITSSGYQFGKVNETISSVLGKNQLEETLTPCGWCLANILNAIDTDHCIKSII